MYTNILAHVDESIIPKPNVFTSGWVAVPLFIIGLLVIFIITHYVLHFNFVHQVILFFVICFLVGFLASTTIPVLSVVAIACGMASALLFVLTSLRL